MQRIERVTAETTPSRSGDLLAAVKRQMGGVPNILATMARSPAALGGYIGLSGALSQGRFDGRLREQIALAVAGANACDYCASAHSTLAGMAGLGADEIARNLGGRSTDPRAEAALAFARRVLETRGKVADSDLATVREAGFDDEEIVEIVGHVVLNIFTNYFNHVAGTEIDFPLVRSTAVAA
ncbi:MAG: carboxymuconolactone decarboxylase family protein [Azospirillaceae bacterium]